METENIQSAYQEEQQRLDYASAIIERQLEALRQIPRYFGIDASEQALDAMREQSRRNLSAAAPEPYFGRLDFQEQGDDKMAALYIGKIGVHDEQGNVPLIIDWRAPIASLFYSFTGGDGPASYESPEGAVAGLVYLKRNLVIRKQILQRVVDAYEKGGDNLAVTDEFLLFRLGENKDNRLRDIVSTIQAEQDKIIRAAKNTALIIQGVAGSGKTTVALHRLAFLLYQYRENIRAEKMIIFAPNRMFLDYISGVLPELGVGDIRQTTFNEWALDLLGHELKLADPAQGLARWFAVGEKRPRIDDQTPGRLKGSVAFLDYLEQCFAQFETSYLPAKDFEAWEGAVLAAGQIREWFYTEYRHYPLAKRCERTGARIKRWIEMQLDRVRESHLRKEYKRKAGQRLKAYLKTWPDPSAFALYKQLFDEAGNGFASPSARFDFPPEVRLASARGLKKRIVEPEDLAPLVFLHGKLQGIESSQMFDHTVIDEAQDFSPFQIALLQKHTRENSFTILGDLSQAIHTYQGIQSWEQFSMLFPVEQTAFHTLNRSYRSTMEIIQMANAVLERSGQPFTPAVPVFRSGAKVQIVQADKRSIADMVTGDIRRLLEGTSDTIALITRTEKQSEQWQATLQASGMDASLIRAGQEKYKGGLSVLPAYLAKGLEFDAVVLVDVDEISYPRTPLEARLLYVGCTRALHELHLYYCGKPSPLIAEMKGDFVDHQSET